MLILHKNGKHSEKFGKPLPKMSAGLFIRYFSRWGESAGRHWKNGYGTCHRAARIRVNAGGA